MPQSVVALYIYRVGRSSPAGNHFTSLNLSGLHFRFGQGGHRSDRSGAPVRLVCSACRSCISHISLIRTPIWTFHIWILIYSTRPIQWWSPNYNLWSLTTPVWLVGPIGLTGQRRRANFGCEHMPPCFLVKLACQKHSQRSKLAKNDDQQCIAHM
jgi:hypothetical protein